MLCTSDDPELAIAPLERSIELSPVRVLAVEPYFNLAVAFSLGRFHESVAAPDEALVQHSDPFFVVFRAAALASAGRVDEARAVLAAFPPFRLQQLEQLAAFWAPRLKDAVFDGFRLAGVDD